MTTVAPAPTQQPQPTKLAYDPHGGARALLLSREREILLEGPANTGKSFAGLWKMHLAALKYPGMHGLLLRKTLVSLKASTLVTYRERILGANSLVKFWSARGDEAAHYAYPNGSKLYVGGMDKAAKIMSTEYDLVLWDEATDGDVGEWEALQTRLRYGVMPYQQAIACCNPQGPSHWLNQRANPASETYDPRQHLMQRITSRHEDNPTVTADYLAMLERLTGVRRARLYLGAWAAADGMVYEDSWDAQRNIRARGAISTRPDDLYGDCGIDHTWPRYLSVDFGFTLTHPFVCRWYAEDGEGTLWMYREIYMTNRLVEDHAKDIRRYSRWGVEHGDPYPRAVICDHDAEGRATLERHLNLRATKADKRVLEGIQVVAARMRGGANGKPGLIYLRDSLVERDRALVDAKRPTCGAEEVESYIWKLGATGRKDEVEKDNDHACLVAGTMVETLNGPQAIETIAPGTLVLTRQGYKRVLASGMTALDAPLMRARFSNGAELVGTPDHPIFANSQYIPLRAARYLDIIEIADDYRGQELSQCVIEASQKSSCTKASTSGAIPTRAVGRIASTTSPTPVTASVVWGDFTRRYGRTPTGRFRRGLRFTTRITTHSITRWRISNCSPLPSITLITTRITPKRNCAGCADAQRTLVSARPTGMGQKRGVSGIVNSRALRMRLGTLSRLSASGVAKTSRQTISLRPAAKPNTARTHARRDSAIIPALTALSASAPSVASHLQPTATTRPAAARSYVLAVSALANRAPVYNLTVEDAHEYFANGILVHNCDCDRYLCMYRDMRARQASYGATLF